MTPRRRPARTQLPPARTPEELAERFRQAGYRVRRPTRKGPPTVISVPPLLPFLLAEHGPQPSAPTEP
jgi:hypothetical protein